MDYMKPIIILFIRFILMHILWWVLVLPVFGQSGPVGTDGDPDQIPVDGGIGFLLAAGAAYGISKYRGKRTNRHPDQGVN